MWNSGDMNAAKAKGWIIEPAAFPTLNFASMAASPPGPGYLPQGADPLFDI